MHIRLLAAAALLAAVLAADTAAASAPLTIKKARSAAIKQQKAINHRAEESGDLAGYSVTSTRAKGCDRLTQRIVECRVETVWFYGELGTGTNPQPNQACVTAHRVMRGSRGRLRISQPSGVKCRNVDAGYGY
jgi:hypothetical protein